MDPAVFYAHSLEQRQAIVNRSGEFITRIKLYNHYISLYVVGKELVEIYYSANSKTIVEIDIIDSKDERLHQYAVRVNLSDLYATRQ